MKSIYKSLLTIAALGVTGTAAIAQSNLKVNTPPGDQAHARAIISAGDPNDPDNNDGLIVPRINAFPGNANGIGVQPIAASKGLLVYLQQTFVGDAAAAGYVNGQIYAPGFYYWTGTIWEKFNSSSTITGPNPSFVYHVANGLNKVGDTVMLGGSLTKNTAVTNNGFSLLFSGTGSSTVFMPSGRIGVGVGNPAEPLHVNGNIRSGSFGTGYAFLSGGLANTAGYTAYHVADGTRHGYIGGGMNNMDYVAENGANHVFAGGKVGVGISTPATELHVLGEVRADLVRAYAIGVGYTLMSQGTSGTSGYIGFHVNGGSRLGYIGNGSNNMQYVAENGANHVFSGANAFAPTFVNTSDARLKKNIAPLTSAIAKVNALHPVSYDWINPKMMGGDHKQIGFLAQEVKEVLPELVYTLEGDNYGVKDCNAVNYSQLTAVLTKAIQEQQVEIEALKAKNAELSTLAAQVKEMQQMLGLNPMTTGAKK